MGGMEGMIMLRGTEGVRGMEDVSEGVGSSSAVATITIRVRALAICATVAVMDGILDILTAGARTVSPVRTIAATTTIIITTTTLINIVIIVKIVRTIINDVPL